MSTANTSWQKRSSEIIDQRHITLPPAWIAAHLPPPQRDERGQAVHESGKARVVADSIRSLLASATEKVVVSSFLLADRAIEDALFATAQRGVRVYVLIASEARLGREVGKRDFDKEVVKLHEQMLVRLAGHVLFRSASHFHAKVIVVDPETQPAGLLLTANLTTEALERNEELAVVLTPREVADATAYLKWAMWESAEHEFVDAKDRYKTVEALGKVRHPSSTEIVATTSNATSLRGEALRLIESARNRIIVSSFGWDAEHEVVRRLAARAREGVEVTVLARVRPASMAALIMLAEAGAKVVGFNWLHAKAIWVDSGEAVVMSANLQPDGLDHGFEFGVRLTESRAAELFARLARWTTHAPWTLAHSQRIGDTNGKVQLWSGDKLVDTEVRPRLELDLGSVTARSAHELVAERPPVPNEGPLPRLAHELHCTWTVRPPLLAAKATEMRRQTDGAKSVSYAPPVFREPDARIVVTVRTPAELTQAQALMHEVGASAIVLAEGASQ